jgi:hypothetical protein
MISLTRQNRRAILSFAGNSQPGNLTPERKGVKTPNNGVFLCLKKIVTEIIRALTMAARLGPLSSGPVPFPGGETLIRAAAQRFSPFGGGLFTLEKGYRYE